MRISSKFGAERSRTSRGLRSAVVIAASAALATVFACGSDRVLNVGLGTIDEDASSPPSFTDPSASDAALADAAREILACMGTECPAPWETCSSGSGLAYKCGTDLSRDSANCGACGNKCPVNAELHMTSRCADGACAFECLNPASSRSEWRNCNGALEDGCEADVSKDPTNCGACGNVCASGTPCIEGKCGCPPGLTACNGNCVDTAISDSNCGACGVKCNDTPDSCSPTPPNAYFGCRGGVCGRLKCVGTAADCNGNLDATQCAGDGCEVGSLATTENCGACGVKCKPGEQCVNEGNGLECAVPCERTGKVLCGGRCADLLNDPEYCGSCEGRCRPPGPNQKSLCRKGVCAYECADGFADCNGDPTDGCETNLRIHTGNCGACGNACDIGAGQPCIEGKCLMVECDGGVTTK